MMGLIRRSFIHLDEEMFLNLYKALVRPHLEYAKTSCQNKMTAVQVYQLKAIT